MTSVINVVFLIDISHSSKPIIRLASPLGVSVVVSVPREAGADIEEASIRDGCVWLEPCRAQYGLRSFLLFL